jgi:hypothetical protein
MGLKFPSCLSPTAMFRDCLYAHSNGCDVMFSICGARGDLSEIPDGPPVDYGSTLLADITYYYNLSGKVSQACCT